MGESLSTNKNGSASENNSWDSLIGYKKEAAENQKEDDKIVGQTFEADHDIILRSEFKRITGEEWPGVKYEAVMGPNSAYDDGYDQPISTYIIREREQETTPASTPESEDGSAQNPSVDPAKEPEANQDQPESNDNISEEEEKAKLEEEEKAKLEAEERAKLERIKEIDEELAKKRAELGPLAAINANFTHDKKELAHDIAEQQLNEEQAKDGLIKRIWKGNLFRKYFQKKYEGELLSGERSAGVNEDGENITLDDIVKDRSGSAIERFVLGATEDMQYIHEKIGKQRKDGTYDGEKLTAADAKTTEIVRTAIEKFAQAKIPEGGSLEDLKREFNNELKRLKAEAKDDGREMDTTLIDNYYDVAIQARERVEHGSAIEKVMEGFRVYNAEVRNNMRTEAHRDNIDKVVNWIESSKIGSIIPAEAIAIGVGTFWSLAQIGTRSAAKLAGPAGGIVASGVFAGLRERNRVTEDRARMLRDAAVGLEYSGMTEEEVKGRHARKRAKYEANLGGTVYDLRPASELATGIDQAIESDDSESILRAIAEARVRISFSDSEQKDLISYSSADKMGDERTKLDRAVIRAEHSLSDEDKKKLETMKAVIEKEITNNVDENDENFKKIRTAQALKQAGKTIAIGSAVFFGSQEIMAALNPNKIGLFEKVGLIKTNNNTEAQETLLAGLAGPRVSTRPELNVIEGVSGDNQAEIQRLEDAGYTKTETSAAWPETKKNLVDIDPSKSDHALKVNVEYADNGTRVSDGNELRLYLENGRYVAGMHGDSTMGDQVFNYEQLAEAGKIKAHINIGGGTFEVASSVDPTSGQIVWPIDANGNITTTAGDVIKAFGSDGEKYFDTFRVVVDNGVDANGVDQVVSLATDVGEGSFSGTMQQISETVVEHPATYIFTKATNVEIPREVSYAGVVFNPVSRVGLGGTRQAANQAPETPAPNAPAPENPAGPDSGNSGNPENPTQTTAPAGEGTPPTATEAPTTTEAPAGEAGESGDESGQTVPENPPAPGTQSGEATSDDSGGRVIIDSTDGPTHIVNGEARGEGGSEDVNQELANKYLKLVGQEGIDIMTSQDAPEVGTSQRIANWWQTLDDEAKQAVIEYARKPRQGQGKALKAWLTANGQF